jgi:uncharacterized protein
MQAQLPPLELLESTHTFPTDFVFKVIGNAEDGFLGRALSAAREAAGLETDPAFTVRQSSGGKHVAVTLRVPTQNAQAVLTVYRSLSTLSGLELLM